MLKIFSKNWNRLSWKLDKEDFAVEAENKSDEEIIELLCHNKIEIKEELPNSQGFSPHKWIPFYKLLDTLKQMNINRWSWVGNTQCKYINLRIDMRDLHCILTDNDGKEITLEQLSFQRKDYTDLINRGNKRILFFDNGKRREDLEILFNSQMNKEENKNLLNHCFIIEGTILESHIDINGNRVIDDFKIDSVSVNKKNDCDKPNNK